AGDLMEKPGWIRMSIHPTTTNEEIQYVCESIRAMAQNHTEWALDYKYNPLSNEFIHTDAKPGSLDMVKQWFVL
ncbi:MAG: selenocysteine lyase, partial [Flavobacterium sp.]